jgi:hypothetical protein
MNATPLLPCPTPEKRAYHSRGEALSAFLTMRVVVAHQPYLCRSGHWHITTKKFSPLNRLL